MRVNRLEAQRSLASEKSFRESEERYRKLFNGGNDAIIVYTIVNSQPDKIIEVNEVASKMLGYSRDELLELSLEKVEKPVDVIIEKLLAEQHFLFETMYMTKDGRQVPVEINAHTFELRQEFAVLSIARDISERRKVSERLQYLATHDPLMDIPNRYLLEEGLKRAINNARRGNKSALLFIDVDNFKLINDTHGHSIGDKMLVLLAGFLKEKVGEEGFLAVLAGMSMGFY
ncbi:hypothetical protein N752_22245 [Desulforamulus aquiferis]|nr:hypothetical protein N752_22245 [Desulforamulus aquiferis]